MRIERLPEFRVTQIALSKRNLTALLTKLEQPGSCCTIYQDDDEGRVYVTAEPDAIHYADREPGPMHPETERHLG